MDKVSIEVRLNNAKYCLDRAIEDLRRGDHSSSCGYVEDAVDRCCRVIDEFKTRAQQST